MFLLAAGGVRIRSSVLDFKFEVTLSHSSRVLSRQLEGHLSLKFKGGLGLVI